MAFASLFIATIVLLILGFGLVNLVIGVVLIIAWKHKKKSGKKIRVVHKIFTFICSITGGLLFVLPVLAFVVGTGINAIHKKVELNRFDTQIKIQDYKDFVDGFEVDGVEYIRADYLHPVTEASDRFCAFVYPDGRFESCYVFDSDSGCDVLFVEHYSGTYVREDEYDEIFEYYMEEAPMEVTVYIDGNMEDSYDVDGLDRDTFLNLDRYFDSDMDFECEVSDIDFSFYLVGYSPDHAFSKSVNFDVVDGQIILTHITGGGYMRGHVLDEEDSEYLIRMIEDSVDYDFNF